MSVKGSLPGRPIWKCTWDAIMEHWTTFVERVAWFSTTRHLWKATKTSTWVSRPSRVDVEKLLRGKTVFNATVQFICLLTNTSLALNATRPLQGLTTWRSTARATATILSLVLSVNSLSATWPASSRTLMKSTSRKNSRDEWKIKAFCYIRQPQIYVYMYISIGNNWSINFLPTHCALVIFGQSFSSR